MQSRIVYTLLGMLQQITHRNINFCTSRTGLGMISIELNPKPTDGIALIRILSDDISEQSADHLFLARAAEALKQFDETIKHIKE